MNPLKDILVVDDEPAITNAVVKVCSSEGMTISAAGKAAEALQCLQENSFRLVLCDIMMPELDGFEFLEELANRGIHTPVVMMTGYSTMENAVKSLTSTGAIDYIPKPFTADELLAVVQRSLRCSRLLEQDESAGLPGDGSLTYVPCPADYYRLGYASWVLMEDEGTAKIGLSDLFMKSVEGIAGFELGKPGEDLVQGTACAIAISQDGLLHDIMCPLSGQILEVNGSAQNDPALVEKDPYFRGWLYRVLPSDLESNLKSLSL